VKAYVFIPMFVVIIVAFGFFIAWVSRKLSGNIDARPFNIITGVLIATILLGVVGMFQPWNIQFYSLGFKMVLIGTLAFTVWSHVTPRAAEVIHGNNGSH
jgi:quinol-cytochrome oxidoreductase complex cytochrome b subunit